MELLLAHPAVKALQGLVNRSEWAAQVWLVGGCVRDALLGRDLSNDFDLVLEGSAVDLATWLGQNGAKHLAVYPRFGTAMVRLEHAQFEFVSARQESYVPSSRKPQVEAGSLLDDARRRDFTCNSLMVNLQDGRLMDLLGIGLDDLKEGVLRTPLDPRQTFFDDPLRMLRAVRFKHQLGFDYAHGLTESIRDESHRLKAISAERIRDEFTKMVGWPDALRELTALHLMEHIIPELLAMQRVEQGKWHHLDVWDHTLLVVQNAATTDIILNLACLLHDVGKPPTRSVDEKGDTRFFTHELVGADMARVILRRLRYDNETIEAVALLVKNHMRLSSAPKLSAPAARRLIRDLGPQLDRLMLLVDADARALKPGVKTIDIPAIQTRIQEVAAHTPAAKIKSPLSGDEIMKLLGVDPGPEVGEAMKYLTEQVIEGHLQPDDEETARQMLRDLKS